MRNGPYELVVAPSDYPGKRYRQRYCYEHHLVWWRTTGSLVKEGCVIHHKNEDKRDNRFENLEEVTSGDHGRHHTQSRNTDVEILCFICSKPKTVPGRNYRFKRRRGQKRFYCSRSCSYKGLRRSPG